MTENHLTWTYSICPPPLTPLNFFFSSVGRLSQKLKMPDEPYQEVKVLTWHYIQVSTRPGSGMVRLTTHFAGLLSACYLPGKVGTYCSSPPPVDTNTFKTIYSLKWWGVWCSEWHTIDWHVICHWICYLSWALNKLQLSVDFLYININHVHSHELLLFFYIQIILVFC